MHRADGTDISEAPLYNTAAVVQRTGIPATTIRAWERRYEYPMPSRDSGGQRLYSERDIQGIRWLSDQTAQGLAISRAVAMLRAGHARPNPLRVTATPAPRSFPAVRADILSALLAFDISPAEKVLAEAFALFTVEEVCLQIVEPLLVEVGDRWHAGEVSVAEEHFATSFIRSRLFGLLNVYQRVDADTPLVFTACAPEEWHEIGILLVSVFLARRGVAVRYLGPNLPLESLAKVVAEHHPAVVALSAQTRETGRRLRGASQLLASTRPPSPRLVFGGQAFNNDLALRESVDGGTYVGPNAAAASDSIVRLLEGHAAAGKGVRAERRRRGTGAA
jgi:methanogenic corrinoid protein MtbC1